MTCVQTNISQPVYGLISVKNTVYRLKILKCCVLAFCVKIYNVYILDTVILLVEFDQNKSTDKPQNYKHKIILMELHTTCSYWENRLV